jgi:cell division protein FtsW
MEKKNETEYYDFSLVAVIVILTCFGLIMLYSTSSYTSQVQYNDDMFYFKKQALISVVCIVGALVISRFDYHILWKLVTPLYVLAFVLMALVKTPLGVTSHGATRWLGVGSFQFQPAEVAKIAVIVTMSYLIVSMGRKVKTLKGCSVLLVTGGIMTAGAYLLTDNLSTAIIILGITVGMIFIAHPKTRIFILLFAVAAFLVMLGVLYINLNMQDTSRFRLRRVLVWLHPEDYASGDGYQTLQALYAIGSGGLFGRGLGNSIQKLGSVPEAQNDMIFSIICEELGLFGGIMVMLLFAYLLYRLFFIAQNAPDMFGSMLVSGIFVHIALQVVLNIAVVLNLMPNTGITLPFISYGGTSVAFLMAEMGLALSVARQIRFQNPQGDS